MTQQTRSAAPALTAFVAAALSLAPAAISRAAGLGDLQTTSALGQPFEARVDISGTEDELSSARASIAPESVYDASGLIRAPILDKFQVEVVTGRGAPYLRISSRQHVGEPMLQLVVDLRSSGSSVRREYAVLLDPPAPLPAAVRPQAQAIDAASSSPAAEPVAAAASPAAVPKAGTPNPPAAPKPRHAAAPVAVSGDRYGPVTSGETLGSITERLRDRLGGSFQARVDAIRRANPGVFEPGRPTWVRLGAMLEIPARDPASVSATPVGESAIAPIPSASASVNRFQLAQRLSAPPPSTPALPSSEAVVATTTAAGGGSAPPSNVAKPAVNPPVPAPSSSAVVLAPPPQRHGWLSDFRLWLALLCLAVVAWLLLSRRRQAETSLLEPDDDAAESGYTALSDEASITTPLRRTIDAAPPTPGVESEPAAEPAAAVIDEPAPVETAEAGVPEPVIEDKLEPEPEENYHGFYGEVAQLLLGALTREPARRDLRMKLLEVYYESREIELFHKHARLYLQSLNGQDDEQWPRIQAMGRELLPEAPLFNATSRSALALAARPLRFYEHDLADTLEPALQALAADYRELHVDVDFRDELLLMLAVIRPPALPLAMLGDDTDERGARVWCKWERIDPVGDAAHVNAYSQAFLALRLQRETLVSATRSGRHGVAVASAAAELGLGCRVHMQESDFQRESESVKQMRALGAIVVAESDAAAAGDARTSALRDWLVAPKKSLYISSLAAGPHPYPAIVRDFQALLGAETKAQVIERFRRRPLAVVVGRSDGPSAISILQAFLDDRETALYCIESDQASASNQSYRREHSWLQHTGRVQYLQGSDLDIEQVRKMIPAQELGMAPAGSVRAAAFALKIASQSATAGEVVVLMRREAGALAAEPLDLEIEPQTGLDIDISDVEPQLQPAVGRVRSRR